MRVRFNLRS
jgi:hypothetical protein